MDVLILMILMGCLMSGCFILGGRFKVKTIADDIEAKGYSVVKWGDSKTVKITGRVKDIDA